LSARCLPCNCRVCRLLIRVYPNRIASAAGSWDCPCGAVRQSTGWAMSSPASPGQPAPACPGHSSLGSSSPSRAGVGPEWHLGKEKIFQPQVLTDKPKLPAFRPPPEPRPTMPNLERMAAFVCLRFPTSNAGGTCALQPTGTAPYSLPIHAVAPPDTHRRLKLNLQCVSGGATAFLRGEAGATGTGWFAREPTRLGSLALIPPWREGSD
jgi:hypothetical protein